MDTKKLAESLLKDGLEQKRKGNLDQAAEDFTEGIANDPANAKIHYELGKVQFLRGDYGISLSAYLAYTHLMLQKRESQLSGTLEFPEDEKKISEDFYSSLPEEVKQSLPRKSASYILEDGDICNHAAHSYFGSQKIEDPEIVENFKLYYSTLVGSNLVQMTVEQFGYSLDKFEQMNMDIFIPNGRMILLDNIAWDRLEEEDVVRIYF